VADGQTTLRMSSAQLRCCANLTLSVFRALASLRWSGHDWDVETPKWSRSGVLRPLSPPLQQIAMPVCVVYASLVWKMRCTCKLSVKSTPLLGAHMLTCLLILVAGQNSPTRDKLQINSECLCINPNSRWRLSYVCVRWQDPAMDVLYADGLSATYVGSL